MENKTPLILISNDDGYRSKGLISLIDMLSDMGQLIVCAPEDARSGFSMAFTINHHLRLIKRSDLGKARVWSCNGTPVDCVKLALDRLCDNRKPDIVIGGINHGDNGSVNSHYSGTMGIVTEGCMKHIPSVAFSLCDHRDDADFDSLRPFVRSITSYVLDQGLPPGVCLNVNFPLPAAGGAQSAAFRGVKVCRMAHGSWNKEVVERHHPRGYDYYWLIGKYTNEEPEATDTDNYALNHGYVAITPTTIDVTAHDSIKLLAKVFETNV